MADSPPPPTLDDFPEVDVGAVSTNEPARASFKQTGTLPEEPVTDVEITLDTGEKFRERMERTAIAADGAAPDGFNFSFSNALLADDGSVARDAGGNLRIVPPAVRHELRVTGADMGRMGKEGLENALRHAREVAAAKAREYFAGMELGEALFADRLPPPPVESPSKEGDQR